MHSKIQKQSDLASTSTRFPFLNVEGYEWSAFDIDITGRVESLRHHFDSRRKEGWEDEAQRHEY